VSGRWVAPVENGGLLIDPPLDRVRELLHVNSRRFERAEVVIAGTDLGVWRSLARRLLQRLSEQTASAFGDDFPPIDPERPIIIAGHQPELFHPGVWIKNFALNGLAKKHQLNPINLIVDNDTVKSTTLRLPDLGEGGAETVHSVPIPFDAWHGEIPYEERRVSDTSTFASFAKRAEAATRRWPFRPMLADFWPEVVRHCESGERMGDGFAAARRAVERRWGCRNVEIPLRNICDNQLFHAFATHILADLPKFHTVYNTCLHSFRRTNDVRSRNHPVPDLAADGDWLEAPFWVWRTGDSRRGRLFARIHPNGERIDLRSDAGPLPAMPRQRLYADRLKYSLTDFTKQGYRIRSRALTTTMFARLFLADLFIHGIGGAQYDALTDTIIKHYFHIEPPDYMVVSGTLRLPFPGFLATVERRRDLWRMARDLLWNPQRYEWTLDHPEADSLAAERERLNNENPAVATARRERFRKIRDVTERLRKRIGRDPLEMQVESELAQCERELAANEILRRRDFAFCLYPEEQLRGFCTGVMERMA
jgi:hypothetical protein